MRTRTRLLGAFGTVLTLGTAAVLVVPGLADPLASALEIVESQDPKRLLLVLGSVVGAYAAWAARSRGRSEPPEPGPATQFETTGDLPETVGAADTTRTGESFDARIWAAAEGDDRALHSVRDALTETAVSTRVRAADVSPEQARRAVETGAWTDDPVAAAFLADEDGPEFPLAARLRAWLDPETERRRRVERTVAAVRETAPNRGPDRRGDIASVGGDST